MKRILELIGREPVDIVEVWRRALRSRIAALEAGRCQLRVPQLRDQMRMVSGMHFHLGPELFIQLTGYTLFQFPRERQWVYPGDICIVPRGMPHGETVGPYDAPFHNLVACGDRKHLSIHVAYEHTTGRPGILDGTRVTGGRLARRALQYLDDAAILQHSESAGRAHAVKGLLLASLGSLLGCIDEQRRRDADESFKVRRCRQFIMTRLSDPDLNVTSLADWMHCSPDYLSHLFHQETGTTLTSHINERRISHARTLLETTSLNISETARAAGYRDPGYFTRVFRKATGLSPREFRQSLPANA